MTVSEDIVLPVGGVILEPIPIARVLWAKALFIFERATTELSASSPPWRRRFAETQLSCGIDGVAVGHG